LQVDPHELESAVWFSRSDVRQILKDCHADGFWVPGHHAIARQLAEHFVHEA